MKKLHLIIFLLFVINCISYGENQEKILIHFYKQLSSIGFALRIEKVDSADFKDFAVKESTDKPKVVSAEKIDFLKGLVAKKRISDWNFVPHYYQKAVKPINPNGKNIIEKWGSGYFTWAMSEDDWKNAASFWWGNPVSGDLCAFPVMWNKNPDISGGQLYVLTYRLLTVKMSDKTFEKYLTASKEWLNPANMPIEQLSKQIKEGTKEDQEFAIRMLGRKKDANGLELIEKYLENNFFSTAQQASFWAIAEINNKTAIPLLIKSFYRKNANVSLIAETFCKIGGEQVHRELKDWLNDPGMSSGRKSSIMYGIWKADYTRGRELIEPFLKSDDKDLKRAAEQAMERLSKE